MPWPMRPRTHAGSAGTMRKKILIVEDNSELLELLRLNLKHAGFAVATATNGIDALKKARSVSPDLVLLDLVLPELDGFAVCETLRKDPATAQVPILVLTGLTSEFARYAGMESGANDCVTKPISPTVLVSKIKRWLSPENAAEHPSPNSGRRRPANADAYEPATTMAAEADPAAAEPEANS